MKEPFCKKCDQKMIKHGKYKKGGYRYRCTKCKKTNQFTKDHKKVKRRKFTWSKQSGITGKMKKALPKNFKNSLFAKNSDRPFAMVEEKYDLRKGSMKKIMTDFIYKYSDYSKDWEKYPKAKKIFRSPYIWCALFKSHARFLENLPKSAKLMLRRILGDIPKGEWGELKKEMSAAIKKLPYQKEKTKRRNLYYALTKIFGDKSVPHFNKFLTNAKNK
jgi:hypothetical protein